MFVLLDTQTDPRVLDVLRSVPGVRVVEGAPLSGVMTDEGFTPLKVVPADADEIADHLDRPRSEPLLLAINAILDSRTAARLEDAGISYVDARGHHWAPGAERTSAGSGETEKRGPRRLSPAAVRLCQLLADHPTEAWSERGLAARGSSTQATVHRLFVRLDREGVIHREGKGRGAVSRVGDVLAMRYWLAREGRPRSARTLACFLRDPRALPRLPGRSFALTGAAGAAELGLPVTTDRARPMFRVNVNNAELEDIPEALGGFRTTEGANAVLVADPDRLAFVDREASAPGHFTAPPSRVMLDLYLEPRGAAAAGVFLDLWADRELNP